MTDVRRAVDPRRVGVPLPAGQENHGVPAKKPMEEPEPNMIIEEKIMGKDGIEYVKKYQRGKFLGKGGFARCYELKDLTTNLVYAAKVVAKNSLVKTRAKQKLTAEIKIHRSLSHANIVKFEHFFEDHDNVYILLEMCNQKSMMELIRKRGTLTEMEARYYLMQVISASKYMHGCRVIHRDLKLGNLFLHNMQIKIGDFGLAAKLDHDGQRKKTICGTPNYIAPEILEGTNGHSYEVDIWSIGVILYTLIIGKPPFETKDVKTTYVRIKANMYSFPDKQPISECAKSLIRRILHTVPEARPTIDEMLQHPFFSGGYTIPKLLPSSALYQPPSPAKSPAKSSPYHYPTSPSYKSPSRVPLAERTNTNNVHGNVENNPLPTATFVPSSQLHNFPPSSGNPTMGSQRQQFQAQYTHQSPTEELDDSQSRKLRRIDKDKAKENDLRTLFLKSRIAETNSGTIPSVQATSLSPQPLTQLSTQPSTQLAAQPVSISPSQTYALPAQPQLASTGYQTLPEQTRTVYSQAQTTTIPPQTTQNPPVCVSTESADVGEEDDQLNVMHQKLVESFLFKGVNENVVHPSTILPPSVWVVKWVDYSNKYGLGYQLSNNIFGAYFNDSTRMVVGGNAKYCEYIDHTRTGCKAYLLDPPAPHPHQLNKKITLLKYFKNYLVEQSNKSEEVTQAPSSNLVYVKKWLRTKHAIVFRLSNGIVQVNFFDHIKIILSQESTVVTYISPNKQTTTQSLSVVVKDPPTKDFNDRLKWIRDILHSMIDHKKAKSKPTPQ